MESLFTRLFRYRERDNRSPEEDCMTEIIAYIFQTHRSILFSFLKECNINYEKNEIVGTIVSTQYVLDNLESRPDIVIKLIGENGKQSIIFVENKIDAAEGPNQLSRYFNYLLEEQLKNASPCHLVYITKRYDSKENLSILSKNKDKVGFTQLRWWQIFQILKRYEDLEIIKEVLKFMKERSLNMSRNFNSFDIKTMMNMNRVMEKVQESLGEKVEEQFYKIIGTKYSITSAESQLRTTGRYIYMGNQDDWFWVGIGYWFGGKVIDNEYPDLGVIVGVKPYHKNRNSIANAILEYAAYNAKWETYGLINDDEWAGMWRKVSLKGMISRDDHLSSIQDWFKDALENVNEFKNKHPELPWRFK